MSCSANISYRSYRSSVPGVKPSHCYVPYLRAVRTPASFVFPASARRKSPNVSLLAFSWKLLPDSLSFISKVFPEVDDLCAFLPLEGNFYELPPFLEESPPRLPSCRNFPALSVLSKEKFPRIFPSPVWFAEQLAGFVDLGTGGFPTSPGRPEAPGAEPLPGHVEIPRKASK